MRKKQSLKTEIEKTIKLLVITLGIIIVVLLIAFLFSTSKKAQQGYQLEEARIQNEDLKDESEGLKAKVTDAQATSTLDKSNKLEDMTPPETESTDYLLLEDNN